MATVLESPRKAQADNRFVIYGVDWETYDKISCALGDHRTRLTFDGENLELMSPSPIHEWSANLLGRMLEALALEIDMPIRGGGSTTFKRSSIERGLEPDECFWIQSESAVRGKMELDFLLDHPPDLAFEVDISRSSLDRLEIYARLGIPEVWTFDGESLRIRLLQPGGKYIEANASLCLPPLPVHELVPFLQPDSDVDDTTRVRRFVEQMAPRFK
jgi:Uma2 family endonuclease